jgi:drug/metabolite transporter (DMT)-like permease
MVRHAGKSHFGLHFERAGNSEPEKYLSEMKWSEECKSSRVPQYLYTVPMPARMALRSPFFSRSWGVTFMLVNVVCWGAALPIVKPALETLTPFTYLFLRFVVAGVLSLPILVWFTWKQPSVWRKLGVITAIELVGTTLALALLYEGLARTSTLEASLHTSTTPIYITFGGILFLQEKEEKREWVGLGLALLGTFFLTLEPFFSGRNGHAEFSFTGNVLVVLQNVATMAYFLLAKRWYQGLPKFFVTAVSFWVGALSFLGLSLWQGGQSLTLPLSSTWPRLAPLLA